MGDLFWRVSLWLVCGVFAMAGDWSLETPYSEVTKPESSDKGILNKVG